MLNNGNGYIKFVQGCIILQRRTRKMDNKYYNKTFKLIFIALVLIFIIMYSLNIVYSNKMHQIFLLMNPIYNNKLSHYHTLVTIFYWSYVISIYALAIPVFCLNTKNKIKGLLYLIIIEVVISSCCYGLDIILKYSYFKPSGEILQFEVSLVGTSIFYLILCAYYIFKKRKEKILRDLM